MVFNSFLGFISTFRSSSSGSGSRCLYYICVQLSFNCEWNFFSDPLISQVFLIRFYQCGMSHSMVHSVSKWSYSTELFILNLVGQYLSARWKGRSLCVERVKVCPPWVIDVIHTHTQCRARRKENRSSDGRLQSSASTAGGGAEGLYDKSAQRIRITSLHSVMQRLQQLKSCVLCDVRVTVVPTPC